MIFVRVKGLSCGLGPKPQDPGFETRKYSHVAIKAKGIEFNFRDIIEEKVDGSLPFDIPGQKI